MPRGGKRNAYPEDFRQSAIELALNDDRSIHEIAKELGIYPKTLYGWVNKYKKEHGIIKHKEVNDLESELKRLKKELAKVKMERDILKKATAYFAKETM